MASIMLVLGVLMMVFGAFEFVDTLRAQAEDPALLFLGILALAGGIGLTGAGWIAWQRR